MLHEVCTVHRLWIGPQFLVQLQKTLESVLRAIQSANKPTQSQLLREIHQPSKMLTDRPRFGKINAVIVLGASLARP